MAVPLRVARPVMAVMCLSSPLELYDAHGLQPLRLTGGHVSTERLASSYLPPVMCPMLRSTLGSISVSQLGGSSDSGEQFAGYVVPSTCDWVTRFGDLMSLVGLKAAPTHNINSPRIKNSLESMEAWLAEVRSLSNFLSKVSGAALTRKSLNTSIALYREAFLAISDLIELKRRGKIPEIWFLVVSGSFLMDLVANWTVKVRKLLDKLSSNFSNSADLSFPPIFLAGSPIVFPNFKIPRLIEEAGLRVVMDDLCSSERVLPGPTHLAEDTKDGVTKALAQRYHLGCLCPTFADDDRRINGIVSPERLKIIRGVVFHVLKGCHPFDLESMVLEKKIKESGLKFIRIETDYTKEDGPTILTRLEAFRATLH
ncbi:MAG: 2-hydroxyacyl-CoA dehydratase family protein [Deltaproteobacteria bacterium]|nr:2-hydroxyacyl-CoA dehydratase family protein [Deltaproteobacteria bacterium]